MPELYDEQEELIYSGRGKYSRRAKAMIAERSAYVRNDEGQLVVYVPENEHDETPQPQRVSTLDEDARAVARRAKRLGRQLGLNFDELEIRQQTEDGELVAHLRQAIQPALVAGLDSDQAAQLVQMFSYWMLRQDISVHDHDELVRNLHELINPMRAPAEGGALVNRDSNLQRVNAVNTVPGRRTHEVHDELWVHAFLPPNRHPCRPSVTPVEEGRGNSDVRADGRIWFEPALVAGPEFVCDNLRDASQLQTFQRGRHGTIRVFLPYAEVDRYGDNLQQDEFRSHYRDRPHVHEHHIRRDDEPWQHCLERFIAACAAVKNSVRSDLRLFVHRGAEQPQEVIL
jgi:hypothetical protein